MSENLKLDSNKSSSDLKGDRIAETNDTLDPRKAAESDDAESQMRKALGLLGSAPRHRPEPDRPEPVHRTADRFGAGTHRRRFVQDGEVPVTILRREVAHETPAPRSQHLPTPAASTRVQRIEVALSNEIAARERAERALTEMQALLRDLQTKIGHAELARAEALETLRQERETISQLRQEAGDLGDRLNGALSRAEAAENALDEVRESLRAEQEARQAAENALKRVEATGGSVRETGRAKDRERETIKEPSTSRYSSEVASISPAIRRRRAAQPSMAQQEPVKWWLTTKPAGRQR